MLRRIASGIPTNIAFQGWATSALLHTTALTVLVVAQGIYEPALIAGRNGPISMPSKPTPGDPDTPKTDKPIGEPLILTAGPQEPPVSESTLDEDLKIAEHPIKPPEPQSVEPALELYVEVATPVTAEPIPPRNPQLEEPDRVLETPSVSPAEKSPHDR